MKVVVKRFFLLILSYSVECRWPLNQVTRWLACHIRLDLVRRLFMFPQIACVGKLHSFSSSSFGEVHVGRCKGYSPRLTKSFANCHNFILFFKPRNFIRTADKIQLILKGTPPTLSTKLKASENQKYIQLKREQHSSVITLTDLFFGTPPTHIQLSVGSTRDGKILHGFGVPWSPIQNGENFK